MINLFIRSIILYLLVFVVIRMTGKRQLRDLQPFDLIVTLLLAELASEPAADASIPLLYGILPILALFLVQMGVSFLSLKSQGFRHILCGTPLLLIARGVVNEQALRDARYSLNDLMEQLRNDGVFDITEVAYVPAAAGRPAALHADPGRQGAPRRTGGSRPRSTLAPSPAGQDRHRSAGSSILRVSHGGYPAPTMQGKIRRRGVFCKRKGWTAMTRRSKFPLVSHGVALLALFLLLFILIVPPRYLFSLTRELDAGAQKAQDLVLGDDVQAAIPVLDALCQRFVEAEENLKLFLNHEDVYALKAALFSARNLAVMDEAGNLLTELQTIIRLIAQMDAAETLSIYNLF